MIKQVQEVDEIEIQEDNIDIEEAIRIYEGVSGLAIVSRIINRRLTLKKLVFLIFSIASVPIFYDFVIAAPTSPTPLFISVPCISILIALMFLGGGDYDREYYIIGSDKVAKINENSEHVTLLNYNIGDIEFRDEGLYFDSENKNISMPLDNNDMIKVQNDLYNM